MVATLLLRQASGPHKPEAPAKERPSPALQAWMRMFLTGGICLFTCALATAQTGGADWPLVPRLSRGQELIYTGSYAEEINGPTVQYTHPYRLESRVFILEATARGADVAF